MNGRNFHRTLGTLLVLSTVCIACIAIIIWLAVAHPSCMITDGPEAHTNPTREVELERLRLDVTNGDVSLMREGLVALHGSFKNVLTERGLTNCSHSKTKICLANAKGYEIHAEVYNLPQTSPLVQCYNVTQSLPYLSDNISTCFRYGGHHWYGAAEVHDQHWPIEKWSIELQEFVVRDPYFPGFFGSVQERYWLSSAGVGIHIPYKVPLFVSMNASSDGHLCFVSQFKDSVYQNIDNKDELELSIHICSAANLTSLHTAMASHFWSKPSARPNIDTMLKPIWSTWAEYKKEINETLLIQYADRILSHNLSISQLEIDDDWTTRYGDWVFSATKFPNAASTIAALKAKVPAVSVWIHPFINTDSEAFLFTADQDMLMKVDKVPGLLKWWNPGYAGLLDFSFNLSRSWFLGKLQNLQLVYGVDSFKFDAGETVWIPKHSKASQPYFDPSEYIPYYVQTAVKADEFARRQEVRVGWRTQSAPILVRMLDRRSRWGIDNGLKTLIPTAITFGILGYPFVLPDMIGGNAYEGVQVDAELYIRWLQVNVFMPAIQFSIPPWHFNDSHIISHTKQMLQLRQSYSTLFDKLSKESVEYGWPMVRPLWWTHPSDPLCQVIDDQFLLGNDLLVAPVVEEQARKRDIYIPSGIWFDQLKNEELEGGQWYYDYSVSLWQLPHFHRVYI